MCLCVCMCVWAWVHGWGHLLSTDKSIQVTFIYVQFQPEVEIGRILIVFCTGLSSPHSHLHRPVWMSLPRPVWVSLPQSPDLRGCLTPVPIPVCVSLPQTSVGIRTQSPDLCGSPPVPRPVWMSVPRPVWMSLI